MSLILSEADTGFYQGEGARFFRNKTFSGISARIKENKTFRGNKYDL